MIIGRLCVPGPNQSLMGKSGVGRLQRNIPGVTKADSDFKQATGRLPMIVDVQLKLPVPTRVGGMANVIRPGTIGVGVDWLVTDVVSGAPPPEI